MENKNVYIGILIVALIVCILSPFLASGDPDGLEASAEHINASALDAKQVIDPAMPDYNFPTQNEEEASPITGVVCLIIGVVLTVLIAYGVFYIVTKK